MRNKSVRRPRRRVVHKNKRIRKVVHAQPLKQIIWMNMDYENLPEETRREHRKMRILMVIDQFNVGGTETHVLTLVRELLRRGVHVAVASKNGALRDAFAALGCPIYELNLVTDDYLPNEADADKLVSQLKKIMTSEAITLVHIHQLPSGMFATQAAKQLRVPCVTTLHLQDQNLIRNNEMLKSSNAIICVSPSIVSQLPTKSPTIYVVPNGVDTVEFDYRAVVQEDLRIEMGIPPKAPIVMYAGRLSWEKADICQDTIVACKQLRAGPYPNLHLLIAGKGHQQERIRTFVNEIHKKEGESFIHLLGNTLNLSALYSLCDCYIGTGRSALEAMACCRPVIAVGSKGFIGLIHPNNYGTAWESWFGDHSAVKRSTPALIANEIRTVLEQSPEEQEERSRLNRYMIKLRFNITRVTNMLIDIYSKTQAVT